MKRKNRLYMKTLEEILIEGTEQLVNAKIDDAKIDAWYLMEHIFGINRLSFLMNKQQEADANLYQQYKDAILKRTSHVPLQHITGCQEFMGLPFYVTKDVLVPRQDTEVLVEEVRKHAKGKRVLDMCTGSGCIICSLAKLDSLVKATGVDISDKALEVARINVQNLEVEVELIQSDLFEQVQEKYDIIVSNPPYIETKEIEKLTPEVRIHEPMLALDGMDDGLYFYRKIISHAGNYLYDQGWIFFEIGYNQGKAVSELLEAEGYQQVQVIKDLSGLDRVVFGIKSKI
jgi:release factor glutamine methyltransferase